MSERREREQTSARATPPRVPSSSPVLVPRKRRQFRPFLFAMGPVALSITSVLLIGLMAVLYLSQVGQSVATNHAIQDIRAEQRTLQRQNQDLTSIIAREQSPAYIIEQAKKLGLVPIDPKMLWILKTSDLKTGDNQQQP